MNPPRINPETATLDDDSPAASCPYCDRPFDSERSCALHVGEDHSDEWTADEKIAYEEATAAEENDLWIYHMKVIIALGVIHAVIILAYLIVLG